MKYLPHELAQLIIFIKCALIIQRSWNRYVMFSHCRSSEWKKLKSILGESSKELCLYADVRREWRREIENWMSIENTTIDMILKECKEGLWGHTSSGLLHKLNP